MLSGSEILQFRGDANLGLGSNAGIPAIDPKADLDVINRTARDILMLNHENNIKLYDQKIADRNTALQMLANGEVASGKISDEDRKVYDAGKSDLEKSFYDMMANGGINNVSAYKDFLDKTSKLSNIATWGQGRDLELTKLQKEKASATLPEDIAAYDEHIKKQQAKPFWSSIDPFQKAFDFSLPSMQSSIAGSPVSDGIGQATDQPVGKATTTTTVSTDKKGGVSSSVSTRSTPGLVKNTGKNPLTITSSQPNADGTISPISYTPEQYWDLGNMIKNANEDLSNPTQAQNQRAWMHSVSNYNEDSKKALLNAYNKRLAQYSEERGIAPIGTNIDGTPIYDSQIKTVTAPDGSLQINETPSSFAAKSTLASIDGNYVQKPQAQFNKDIGAYNVQMKKANTDSFYKHAMANNASRRTQGYLDNIHQQMKLRGDAKQQDDFLNDLYTKNTLSQQLLQGAGDGKLKIMNVPVAKSTPMFFFNGKTFEKLKGIGGTMQGNPVYNTKGENVSPVTGGVYEPEIVFKGKPVSSAQITDMYHTFRKNAGKNFKGDIHDFMNGCINNNLFEVNYIGTDAQGNKVKTNRAISNAALKAMTTKKGAESVFDQDTPIPQDEPTIPDNTDNPE